MVTWRRDFTGIMIIMASKGKYPTISVFQAGEFLPRYIFFPLDLSKVRRNSWQSHLFAWTSGAKCNSRLMQNCKDQRKTPHRRAFETQPFQMELRFGKRVKVQWRWGKLWQHGDLKLHHAEEECESFLIALHRWNTVAWPLDKDDTRFNRDVCIFTESHVKSTCMHSGL